MQLNAKKYNKTGFQIASAVLTPAEYLLLEIPVQLDGAASLALIDSSEIHCFVQ